MADDDVTLLGLVLRAMEAQGATHALGPGALLGLEPQTQVHSLPELQAVALLQGQGLHRLREVVAAIALVVDAMADTSPEVAAYRDQRVADLHAQWDTTPG